MCTNMKVINYISDSVLRTDCRYKNAIVSQLNIELTFSVVVYGRARPRWGLTSEGGNRRRLGRQSEEKNQSKTEENALNMYL